MGNYPRAQHSASQSRLPLFHVGTVDERGRETKSTEGDGVSPHGTAASNLPLFCSEEALALLGEFDGQLSVCQSIM